MIHDKGNHSIQIYSDMEYVTTTSITEHLNVKNIFSEEKKDGTTVNFYLPPKSIPIIIENIFYDFNQSTIRPESKESLQKLISMMEDNRIQ